MESVARDLTDEQALVSTAEVEDRVVVDAPPGTGKTHTLVERALYLADLSPPPRVVALSFSRDVVRELSFRMSEAGAGHVRGWTIDSYAAAIRRMSGGELLMRGFDHNIKEATRILEEDLAVGLDIHHLLVDEIQDLRGPRRRFVLELIRKAGCGFTAFGDPGQGIYGFNEDDSEQDVFDSLVAEFGAETLHLTRSFRNPDLGLVPKPSDPGALDEYFESLPVIPDITKLRPWARKGSGMAILTRTNGEALRLSHDATEVGIEVNLRQRSYYAPVPSWVLSVFENGKGDDWTKERFEIAVAELEDVLDPSKAWSYVRSLVGASKKVNQTSLRVAIARGPRVSSYQASSGSVVSTIHRAKGLEWDLVIVADPDRVYEGCDRSEEDRIRYVAVTRSRNETFRMPYAYLYMATLGSGRWILPYPQGGWKAIEMMPGDVDDSIPFPGEPEADIPRLLQVYLREKVKSGDSVVLRESQSPGVLTIFHDEMPIGRTGTKFIEDIGAAQINRMIEASGTRILDIRVATGSPELTEDMGLSDSGMWLVPEVAGLSYPEWRKRDQ